MKIGVAALGNLSEDTGGKNYILHFFRELVEINTKHEFVLFLSEGEKERLALPKVSWLRIMEVPNSSRSSLHKVIGEQWKLNEFIDRSGVKVMYYPGNFVSLRSRVPAVVNIRATANFYGKNYGLGSVRRIVRSWLMPLGASRAKVIITPSEAIKSDVVRFMQIQPAKITVIPHGVDMALFNGNMNRADPAGFALLERFALKPQKYLLYVSALWRYKNQKALIEAHAMLDKSRFGDLKLVIAGMGTGTEKSYLKELYELPQKLGTADRVVFTGGLDQSDLRFLYAHASALVFPSLYESFGNPIFEAWASGIPVLTSNVHSFPEVVKDAGVLFDPLKPVEIAKSIENVLSNAELRSSLIARGKERVEYFTWQRAVSRTLRVIEIVSEIGGQQAHALKL